MATIKRILVYGALMLGPKQLEVLAARGVAVSELPVEAAPQDVHREIALSDAVIFNNVDINPFLVSFKPSQIGILAATGYSFIDLPQARRLGVRLAHLKAYSIPAVVEFMLAAAFSAVRPLCLAAERASRGTWGKEGLFGTELAGRTAGIIGYGQIGARLAAILKTLGMTLVVTSRKDRYVPGAVWRPLEAVIRDADFLFICCDANSDSERLLDKARLSLMRPSAVLISISSNSVIDLAALADVLAARPDVRAILDLDPLPDGHPLLSVPTARITPHVAFATMETLERRLDDSIDTVFAAVEGGEVAWLSPEPVQDCRIARRSVIEDLLTRRDRLLELASSFAYAQSLYALVRLGVLGLLEEDFATARTLAERLNISADNLSLLLDAAVALEILERRSDGSYGIARGFVPLLAPSSPYDVGPMIASAVECAYEPWKDLASFLCNGVPPRVNQSLRENSPDWARRLTHGSNASSKLIAEHVVDSVGVGPIHSILDVGCGSAVLCRKLLRRFPRATAVLIDRALPLEVCRRDFLEPEEIAGRCSLIDLDFTDSRPFPGRHDVVILMNVIHMVSPSLGRDLIRRSAAALVPGGRLVLTSFLSDDALEHPFPRHFSISCRLLSGQARGYRTAEIVDWLEDSGLDIVRSQKVGIFTAVIWAEKRGI